MEARVPTALLSVHDKTGLVEFASALRDMGWALLASDGTASLLRDHGIAVTSVAEYTGSPEILDGRVKTMHPAVHGGVLASDTDLDRTDLDSVGADLIDLVVVNLYPFEATIARPGVSKAEAIANIDIGGVALMRAGAKNHERVTLVCEPVDYPAVAAELAAGGTTVATRARLAAKGFTITARYDHAVAAYLATSDADEEHLRLYPIQVLRYGENPHQAATLFSADPSAGPLGGVVLQGKPLSYNNLLDLDAAWKTVVAFQRPTVCIVKHLSPCGVASAGRLVDAFQSAFDCDPLSAFGGVIASNRAFDEATAIALGDVFVECIAAPAFSAAARAQLANKKNCRLVQIPNASVASGFEWRSITGGLLRQEVDLGDPAPLRQAWKTVSRRHPTESEWIALDFAWTACQHVRSNAIVVASGESTVGIGGGQPSRIDSVRIAVARAGSRSAGAVMASDAFFPFADSLHEAAQAGITAVIQPGGSLRDLEVIAAADAADIAMVVTATRHFKH